MLPGSEAELCSNVDSTLKEVSSADWTLIGVSKRDLSSVMYSVAVEW